MKKSASKIAEEVLEGGTPILPVGGGVVLGGAAGIPLGFQAGARLTGRKMRQEKAEYLRRKEDLLRKKGLPTKSLRKLPPEIQQALLKIKEELGIPDYGRGTILRGDMGKAGRTLGGGLRGSLLGLLLGAGLGGLGGYGLHKLVQD